MSNLREQILAANTLKSEAVEVPEWGGTFFIRVLNPEQLVDYYKHLGTFDNDSPGYLVSLSLLTHCLVDDKGNRILTDDDAVELNKQHGALVNHLCRVATEINEFERHSADTEKK